MTSRRSVIIPEGKESMSTVPPSMSPSDVPPQSAAKKTSPLVWILAGIGVIVVLAMITCGVGAFFIGRGLKNAGFDSDLMKKNPGLAMTKMVTALNPNFEVVSTNDGAGTVTVREKSTGKTVTYKFDPDKQSLVIIGDDGAQVKIGASAANKMPDWAPVYPGSSPEGTYSVQSSEGNSGTFTFKTSDAASKVTSYYQDQLRAAGFNVTLVSSGDQGGMLSAEDADKKRTIIITAGASNGTTTASVIVNEKK
jgi:hypothetical protein